jgi:single-strand DNA-binding protein
MSSLNKVMLIGNLGKDPEVRFSQEGTPVATFSLATTDNWTDKTGNRQERTEWHNIVAWNKLADLAKRFLNKGRQVYVEGRLQTREWTDKEGNKRRTTEVICTQIVLLGSRQQAAQSGEPAVNPVVSFPSRSAQPVEQQDAPDLGITDDDIPF